MADVLHADFETFCEIDLTKVGAHKYATHPSADILCLGWAFNDEEPEIWIPGDELPDRVVEHILDNGVIEAWNAEFERLMFTNVAGPKYGWPVPGRWQYDCVMTRALAMGFPAALAFAAPAAGLEMRKDDTGKRVMLQLCKPRKPTIKNPSKRFTPENAPFKFQTLYEYCKQDVRVEQAMSKRVVKLIEPEQRLYHLCSEINDRGVPIDLPLIKRAQRVVDQQLVKLDAEMARVTDGVVFKCSQSKQLTNWLGKTGLKWDELELPSVAKDPLARMLARDDLTPAQRRALELRQEAAKTSTAKLESFETHMSPDGTVKGTIQFHGASTGRDAARGVQVQNFPRPGKKTPVNQVIQALMNNANADDIDCLFGPPMAIISDILRSCIRAPKGKKLWTRDLSQIEARMTAYLAGAEDKLEAFRRYDRKEGPDIYTVAAAGIYNKPAHLIDKDGNERQTGKVSELALGFGGGAGAYGSMAKIYQLDLKPLLPIVWSMSTVEFREKATDFYKTRGYMSGMHKDAWLASELIKLAWRESNPEIVQLWRDCENAVVLALQNYKQTFTAGLLKFRHTGSFIRMILPSGRALFFPFPRLAWEETPWGKMQPRIYYHAVDGLTKRFMEFSLWGGLITQNAVQAASRDVMFDAVLRLEKAGYPNIMRVHDECVCMTDDSFGDEDEFHSLFVETPTWAPGLPIAADGWTGERYRK